MPDYRLRFKSVTGYWVSSKRPPGLKNWWNLRRYYVGVRPRIRITLEKWDDRAKPLSDLRVVEARPEYPGEQPQKKFEDLKKINEEEFEFVSNDDTSLAGEYAIYIGAQLHRKQTEPIMTATLFSKDVTRRDIELILLGVLVSLLGSFLWNALVG